MGILLLAISSEDLTHDEQVELVGVTVGLVFEGVDCSGGGGSLAGEKGAAVLLHKQTLSSWVKKS